MVGRLEEIKTLDEVLSRKEGQFVAVYGRRRIGKTYLIRQYFKGKFTFYHTGESNVGFRDQLIGFRDSLRDYGHQCQLPKTWREAFRELRSLIEASKDEKKIVFIDEMPWLDTPRSKFLPALEHFWNSWGSSRQDLVMIVCGSASTWIIKNILKNRGGLHNRITDQIHLMPFTLRECEELVRDSGLSLSRQEICSLYMIFGGVAYYWGFLRKGESVAQSVDRLFDSLEKCGFVRRYTAYGKKRRDALYQLMDSFSLFHLRFIEPESNPSPNEWTVGVSSKARSAWEGLAFERVCLMHIREIKRALQIDGVKTSVCSWRHVADETYGKGAQIDLMIDRADNVINICEMKYSSGKYTLSKSDCENSDNKLDAFRAVSDTSKSLHLTIITANGLAENAYARKAQNVLVLDDLFA